LSLFAESDTITSQDAAEALGLSTRMVRLLLKKWTQEGWLIESNPSNRARAYQLSAIYRQFVGNPSAK
jgi:MarR-like DNA-binding transcriptional regulator SgrR of sgrS sRNA